MITDHLTLLTDLYELTMMQGYFKTGNQNVVIFDAFYRTNPDNGGYAIFAGLAQIIDYIEHLHLMHPTFPICVRWEFLKKIFWNT